MSPSFSPEQKNPPASAHSLVFQHLLRIYTLSSSDCMILKHGGQLRDSNTTITKEKTFTDAQESNTMHKSWGGGGVIQQSKSVNSKVNTFEHDDV